MSERAQIIPAGMAPGFPAPAGPAAALRWLGDGSGRLLAQPALKRSLPMLAGMGALGAVLLGFMVLREPPRAPLLPGLSDADKAAVVEALKAGNFDVEVDAATGVVEVPAADVHKARMLLASQGLPKAVPGGYDLLTDMPLGASRTLERARLKQAQEGELARSIEAVDGVASARVTLALSEPTPFVRDITPPSASVFVTLAPGRALGEAQVRAIMHLVASAVPGLALERVAVVDGAGQLLSPDAEAGDMGESAKQLSYQGRLERRYRERVAQLLGPVLGFGNFTAQVHLDLDFTRQEQTSERYQRDNTALRSEQGSERKDASLQPRGIPGALSNAAPPAPQVTTAPPETLQAEAAAPEEPVAQNSENSFTRNYEVGKDVSVTRPEVGEIARMAVSVVVRDGAGEEGPKLTPTRMAELQRLVETAVGFDARRGDRVTIVRQPFLAAPESAVAPWWRTALVDHIPHLVGLLALAILAFVLRPLLRRREAPPTALPALGVEAEGPSLAGPAVRETEAVPDSSEEEPEAAPTVSRGALLLDSANSYDDKVAAVRVFVGEDVARASTVLKQIMRAEKGGGAA